MNDLIKTIEIEPYDDQLSVRRKPSSAAGAGFEFVRRHPIDEAIQYLFGRTIEGVTLGDDEVRFTFNNDLELLVTALEDKRLPNLRVIRSSDLPVGRRDRLASVVEVCYGPPRYLTWTWNRRHLLECRIGSVLKRIVNTPRGAMFYFDSPTGLKFHGARDQLSSKCVLIWSEEM